MTTVPMVVSPGVLRRPARQRSRPSKATAEAKVWSEPIGVPGQVALGVRFRSLEAGAKLLSPKNRILLRTIAERKPQSVTALATMTGRTPQNLLRTLNKLVDAGIVRLHRGDGRARRPVLAVSKIHVEVDLLAG